VTRCNRRSLSFSRLSRQIIVADFDGGRRQSGLAYEESGKRSCRESLPVQIPALRYTRVHTPKPQTCQESTCPVYGKAA